MPEVAKITPIGAPDGYTIPETKPENGRNRLEGESQLWFNRYCLYRDLGPKRSLRAAVAKEHETVRLVKQPQTATKSKKVVAKPGQKLSKAVTVPEPIINVPGSWKDASKRFRWIDRAEAFDTWLVRLMTETTYKQLGDTFANKFKRVQLLDILVKNTVENLNTSVTHQNRQNYLKQIISLIKQIEHEMSTLSPDEMKAAIAAHGHSILEEMEEAFHAGKTGLARKL